MREKLILFQWSSAIISRHFEGGALPPLARAKRLFKDKQTGNKSLALPINHL